MKENRIVVTETMFTNICKNGSFMRMGFTKAEIKTISTGQILEKEKEDELFKFALQDIGKDTIIEILKRSPIYSDLAYEL